MTGNETPFEIFLNPVAAMSLPRPRVGKERVTRKVTCNPVIVFHYNKVIIIVIVFIYLIKRNKSTTLTSVRGLSRSL